MHRILSSVLIVSLISIFTIGCGGESVQKSELLSNSDSKLNSKNFVEVASYQFKKANMHLGRIGSAQEKKSRNRHPGIDSQTKREKDVFYVNTVAPFNKYIQKLSVNYNDQKIDLLYTPDNDSINITYFDGSKRVEKTLTLSEFLTGEIK